MTATLTTGLTRLALNLTRSAGAKGGHSNVYGGYGISRDDLYGLIAGGLLTGPDRAVLDAGSARDADCAFKLTTKGDSWLNSDLTSVLSRPVRDAAGMRLVLRDYVKALGGDKQRAKDAFFSGLIRCTYAGDDKPCKTLGDYELRNAGDFAVHPTEKLRRAIG